MKNMEMEMETEMGDRTKGIREKMGEFWWHVLPFSGSSVALQWLFSGSFGGLVPLAMAMLPSTFGV
jgi:hypothetical protein